MLTKLLKHEFSATWKVPVALDGLLIVLGLLAHLMIRSIPYIKDSIGFIIIMGLFVGVYYIGIIAANIVTMVFLVMRYYRNLYTAEGYLTFTLPVSTADVIHTKVITGYCWMLLAGLSTILSLAVALTGLLGMTDVPYEELRQAAEEFFSVFGMGPALIITLIITLLISPLYNILSLYVSVTIGQLWEKHKILGAVLCYIGVYMTNLFISQFSMISAGFFSAVNDALDDAFASIYISILGRSAIISAVLSIAFYTACIMITKKKVNLD